MRTMIGLFTAISLLSSSTLIAQELSTFDLQVRETLLRNPEIILEVFELLEEQEKSQAARQDIEKISKNEKALFGELDPMTPVIVEFLDYRCGYCRRNHAELIDFLETNPNVVLIEKHFPILGQESVEMSQTALAIRIVHGDVAYRAFHNAMMGETRNGEVNMAEYIMAAGLDKAKIEEAYASDVVLNEISNVRGLARRLGISGTPAFISRTSIVPRYADVELLTQAVFGAQK